MIYDSIKTYRIQLDPVGTIPNIDVGVRVDGRDIPDARVNYVAMIFVDRVVHTLEELFGLDKPKVDSIREDLEAGRPVHIEVQALRAQLIQNEIRVAELTPRPSFRRTTGSRPAPTCDCIVAP